MPTIKCHPDRLKIGFLSFQEKSKVLRPRNCKIGHLEKRKEKNLRLGMKKNGFVRSPGNKEYNHFGHVQDFSWKLKGGGGVSQQSSPSNTG